jgi:hypothetical protein
MNYRLTWLQSKMAAALVPGLEGDTLLEQMNKLFAPPGRAGVADVGEAHPYFKRPGKGHNHDCCDSCAEGGALVRSGQSRQPNHSILVP